MHIDPTRLFKSDVPQTVVVLDAEVQYDHAVHARYQAAERFLPADALKLTSREARSDPRVTPRWACQRLTTLSWLVMTDGDDGLRPVRLETRGAPEQDEAQIVAAFFADMERLGHVQVVTYNGFGSDLPQIMLAAAAAGLRLPPSLVSLHTPWRRTGHVDLMAEMCGGADRVHLAEVAAKFGIPAKLTCRPDLVTKLMEQGKWSSVKACAEGDTLTTAMILMRWRHLLGGSTSVFEATRRLTTFIAEHCPHRPYAADWSRYGEQMLHDVMTAETAKLDAPAPEPSIC